MSDTKGEVESSLKQFRYTHRRADMRPDPNGAWTPYEAHKQIIDTQAAELRLLRQDTERLEDELRKWVPSPDFVSVDVHHLEGIEFASRTIRGNACPACLGIETEDYGYSERGPDRGHETGCWLRTALDTARQAGEKGDSA